MSTDSANKVVCKYPLAIRCGAALVCLLLAVGTVRDRGTTGTIIAMAGAACLCVGLWAYRVEVEATGVQVRYLPFCSKRTPARDITHVVEGKSLVLVTAKSRIPLWGLSMKDRGQLFDLIPRHADMAPAYRNRTDSAAVVRRHVRWTILSGVSFAVTAAATMPFLAGFPLQGYWDVAGKYVLLLCMGLFVVFVAEAGFTYVLWSSKRAFDKIEREQRRVRRRS